MTIGRRASQKLTPAAAIGRSLARWRADKLGDARAKNWSRFRIRIGQSGGRQDRNRSVRLRVETRMSSGTNGATMVRSGSMIDMGVGELQESHDANQANAEHT